MALIGWGRLAAHLDAVGAAVGQRFQLVGEPVGAGGMDLADDQRVVAALRAAPPPRLLLALEAGQQPTREVTSFLTALREALGEHRPLLLALLVQNGDGGFADADPEELEMWRVALAAHGDAYAWVETVAVPR